MGLPYVPLMALAGSDLLRNRDDMMLAPDPFRPGTETLVAKALRPEVAALHARRADRAGNVSVGVHNDDVLLAEASRWVIVTAEEVVERLDEAEAEGTFLPSLLVDAVVEAPFGAHPAGLPGRYPVDAEHMRWYAEQARSDEAFADYVARTVTDVAAHADYVERFVPADWRAGAARAAGD